MSWADFRAAYALLRRHHVPRLRAALMARKVADPRYRYIDMTTKEKSK